MGSNVKPTQRAFALTIALIFLVTTLATSVFVVMAIIDESKNKNDPSVTQTTSPSVATNSACTIGAAPNQVTLPVPEAYKPPGDVTALETVDIEVGSGAEVKSGDCLVVKYYGTLASNGEKFDENFTTSDGLTFGLGAGSVIAGWDQGVVGMKVGGTRRLVIPSDLAYRDQAAGTIPANADLVFVVKVLAVK